VPQVEVVTWLGLVRYHVLFAIDIASRKVEILGPVVNPEGAWREQIARKLVDVGDGFLLGKRYVLTDRDPLHTKGFREILKQRGVKLLRLPAKSPNLSAFAQRFVLSVRTEFLDRIVPLGEPRLQRAITESVQHCHHEREHQRPEKALIGPGEVMDSTGKAVRCDRLGGVLGLYHREAARTPDGWWSKSW